MRISNELLSSVLGCECEFKCFSLSDEVVFRVEDYKKIPLNIIRYLAIESFNHGRSISLDTFIRFGKIWAFECGYQITVEPYKVVIINTNNPNNKVNIMSRVKQFLNDGDVFDVNVTLNALEWVCGEVKE